MEASATLAKQQTVATEQESEQDEKKDITQLYIGLNIDVRRLFLEVESIYQVVVMFIRDPRFLGLASETRCKRQPRVYTEHIYVALNL